MQNMLTITLRRFVKNELHNHWVKSDFMSELAEAYSCYILSSHWYKKAP